MRLSLRFILPLFLVLGLVAYSIVPLVDRLTLKWFSKDLDLRTQLIADSVHDSLAAHVAENSSGKVAKLFNRMIQDQRLYAIGFCGSSMKLLFKTQTFPEHLNCEHAPVAGETFQESVEDAKGPMHISYQSIQGEDKFLGHLVLIHDMSFVERRSADTRLYIFYLFVLLGTIVSAITVIVAQLSWKGWVRGIRALISGEGILKPMEQVVVPELKPIAKDLRALIRDLETDRKSRD